MDKQLPMRVALLSSFFPPEDRHGIARYVEVLALGLASRHLDVVVIASCAGFRPTERRDSFTVRWVNRYSSNLASKVPSLRLIGTSLRIRNAVIALHLERPFDIVEYPNDGITALAMLIQGIPAPRPRFVLRLSSPKRVFPKTSLLPRLTERLEAWQARRSDAFIGNTKANLELCEQIYHLPSYLPRKVILHGLPWRIQPTTVVFSRSQSQKNLLFIGRMELRKGFDILAAAWPRVGAAIPDARLIVAGEDLPCSWGPSFFHWAIRDMPIEARQCLNYIGIVSLEQRDCLYRETDLCVVPSRYESFGMVLLEAMRYGKPVISCQAGGIPEVIEQGKTGLLVPPEDPDALAEALVYLLSNPTLRKKMGEAAKEELKSRFTADRVAADTESFYRQLLGQDLMS